MAESWNAWIGEMKKTLIISLMEPIKKRMMGVINDSKVNYLQWKTDVPAFINNKMNQTLKKGRKLRVTPISGVLFVVNLQQSLRLLIIRSYM